VEYKYDGVGRLIGRTDADGEQIFVQAGWSIMTEQDSKGRRTYYTGSSAVKDNSSDRTYFHFNHRGDTIAISDKDGNISDQLYYEAYGKVTDSNGNPANTAFSSSLPPLFVGAFGIRYDRKTELSYMRFRWYSCSNTRFITSDIILNDNKFFYVDNNPISRIDIFGLDYLLFDGIHLIWYSNNGQVKRIYFAYSGKPWEKLKPLPEGIYNLNPGSVTYHKSLQGPGDWSLEAWGPVRVPLIKIWTKNFRESNRDEFFIHGGYRIGTAGCIEIAEYDKQQRMLRDFFARIIKHDKPINVIVDYSQLPYDQQVNELLNARFVRIDNQWFKTNRWMPRERSENSSSIPYYEYHGNTVNMINSYFYPPTESIEAYTQSIIHEK
jgi:RHS repeat-associated protein